MIAQFQLFSLSVISSGNVEDNEENYDGSTPPKYKSVIPAVTPGGCEELRFEMMKIYQCTEALDKSYNEFIATENMPALEKAGEVMGEIVKHFEKASAVVETILKKITTPAP